MAAADLAKVATAGPKARAAGTGADASGATTAGAGAGAGAESTSRYIQLFYSPEYNVSVRGQPFHVDVASLTRLGLNRDTYVGE